MNETVQKHVIIVDHRKDWQQKLEEGLRAIYPDLLIVCKTTVQGVYMALSQISVSGTVTVQNGFKPEEQEFPKLDLVVFGRLQEGSVESIRECVTHLESQQKATLDLSLALDHAPNASILTVKEVQKTVKRLLNLQDEQ